MTRATFLVFAPVALSMTLVEPIAAQQAPVKRFATKDGKRPKGLFAPGVMVGKTLYVAGKGDYRPDAEFPDKVTNCLNEVRKVLRVAGMDMENVVKSFVYLEDHDKYDELNAAYGKFFPNDPPARTTFGVARVPGESRLEITCIAYADLSEKKRIGEPQPRPYSSGILAGDMLYVSGKGDQLPGGGHPKTVEEQVRQAMRNVEATLKLAGLDFRHVVMSHVFLDNYETRETVDKVYGEFFAKGDEPACATVYVDWLPGGSHVEITCFATTDLARRKIVRPKGLTFGPKGAAVRANPAVWAGDTLYLSALTGIEAGQKSTTVLGDQVHRMGRNDTALLDAAGLKLDDIVSGCVYLRKMDDYRPMNAIYKEYFSRGPGVRTCLTPSSGYETNNILVQGSFIAARTR